VQRVLLIAIAAVGAVLVSLLGVLVVVGGARSEPAQQTTPAQQGRWQTEDPLRPHPDLAGLAIPPFELVDQSGQQADQSLLDGRVTIVDFIFTNCPFACPGMTGQMLRLQDKLAGTGARFLSVSVDPERDTPERLAEYADRNGIDTSRWPLLTGPFETVRRVVREGLKFAVGPDDSRMITLPDGSRMANIMHPPHLILVGPQRRVLGLYPYSEERAMRELERHARAAAEALAGAPRG